MAVTIAEYLGQNVEGNSSTIEPAIGLEKCPFMNDVCGKLVKNLKPICSVRRPDGEHWIVCSHRLCSTKSKVPLSVYQKDVLMSVAKCVFGQDVQSEDIAIRREETIPVVKKSNYHADYIMLNVGDRGRPNGQTRIVLEMQGGGETSSTGSITRLVEEWEKNLNRTNKMLSTKVKASPIVTNAWRRQQEQFIIKGNIAQQTGGGLVFCVGKPLYDYLSLRIQDANLNSLKEHNWTLALLAFTEEIGDDGSIKFVLDEERQIFTNYVTFVQTLINQGKPYPAMFEGTFELLNGDERDVSN